ncbi:hypothetical protein K461DRAFT_294452 [Myriangium duriaei CBS 260.36]|uniref:Uncharacterized protein n=1 Tax=Myriangium duriaei CBS 260.36 TaxID=1168546 RepID=A0A9P4MFW2_9PEZI|nr:hypothetical protein K461DRAFT_294452 [Myriangium duriaei CBS 260.36]
MHFPTASILLAASYVVSVYGSPISGVVKPRGEKSIDLSTPSPDGVEFFMTGRSLKVEDFSKPSPDGVEFFMTGRSVEVTDSSQPSPDGVEFFMTGKTKPIR